MTKKRKLGKGCATLSQRMAEKQFAGRLRAEEYRKANPPKPLTTAEKLELQRARREEAQALLKGPIDWDST
ncbi:hypothetical protein [Tabrizicola sp. M-4]|uniref:hypothetical protein n=1 Tax=Tabrizicola sp. M-4 TaxID=3055847 RepID=UPI003DA7C68E